MVNSNINRLLNEKKNDRSSIFESQCKIQILDHKTKTQSKSKQTSNSPDQKTKLKTLAKNDVFISNDVKSQ
jgi:hypothetical protein